MFVQFKMITELNTKIIEYFLMKLLTGLDIDYPILKLSYYAYNIAQKNFMATA